MLGFQKFEDDVGAIRHGFYRVGDKTFFHKINALIHSSSTKLPVQWEFNQDIFAAAAAKPRLDISLLELYRLRCQQLRDNYDYVILGFSGGSDSDTILKAFLNNNIKVDEVWFDQPFEFIEKSNYSPNLSTESVNLASEWYYIVKPELERLQVTHPEIKIHVSDSCKDPSLEDYNDSHLHTMTMTYNGIKRWRYMTEYIQRLESQQKKVCLVLGIDKCIPARHNKSYGFSFVDNPMFAKHSFLEYFYWTPDMPEIIVHQAHKLWDYFDEHPGVLSRRVKNMLKNRGIWSQRDEYDRAVKSVIYPQWDLTKHQVDKQQVFLAEGYRLFIDCWKQEKFYQSWESSFKNIVSQLDSNMLYKNNQTHAYEIKPYHNFHAIQK